MLEFLRSLLLLDTRTMLAMLFWGNLVSTLLILAFQLTSRFRGEWRLSSYYALSKLCLTIAHFCLFFRGDLPVFISVNYGNTLLLTGLCLEALALLSASRTGSRCTYVTSGFMLLLGISVFNIVEGVFPDASIRVFSASMCVFGVLIVPCLTMLCRKSDSSFQRVVGICYACFVSLLIPRAIYALTHSIDVHSSFFAQTLTYLFMDILMVFSLLAYMLLGKEHAEQHITMLSRTDMLTGLSNRPNFFEAGAVLFKEHRGRGEKMGAVLVDIVGLKRINEAYGQGFGDQVLTRIASIIRGQMRECDLAARHGAGEFVILQPRSERDLLEQLALKLQTGIEDSFFAQHAEFRLKVDVGVFHGQPGESARSLEDFVNMASHNMRERRHANSARL